MPPFAKPETVLKRSEELINVGQHQAALAALNDIFTSRRFKQTPLQALEPIMIRFVDLCVDLKKGRMAKEGLMQYKNVSQNTNPQSIELVINHFIKLADANVVHAQSKADAAVGDIDIDDLEESETPESMLLGSVSPDQSKDRTDRVLVTPWLKFLWEAYRTALDILRNNARLEVPYQQIANHALKFCLQYERKTEFRRLCEVLRQHLQNVARYSHHAHAINLTDQDTLQRHLDTRFAQLNAAVELELWQEAFRSVEDIHNLLTMAKKAPRPAMMANYYDKLARIFIVSDNHLFHAAAWNRYYALARSIAKSSHEHTRIASYVLISALAVPVISSNAPGTGNLNKSKSDFLHADHDARSRTGRLTSLLGLSRTPTRAGLLKEALNRDILKKARPELRELYNMLEVEFHPLSICAKIEPILASLSQHPDMAMYVKPLHSVVLTRLFQQLSQVYDAVKLDKLMHLVSAFKAPRSYTAAEIEKFCLNACKKGHLNIRIDHVAHAITFHHDVFSTHTHPAAASSSSADADTVRLQATPSQLVRTQLSRLAACLDTMLHTIHPSLVAAADAAKRDVFARAVAAAHDEHKAAIARKAILARRKQLLEQMATRKEREDAAARAERARAAAEAEQKRIAEDAKRREQERINREVEAVRIEEAKKMAKSLQERGGLKLTEEELANMDTDKLVQMQVEQIEREKKELAERLRLIHRKMDHLERAYRREEAPLLSADYERQKYDDLKYHKAARITLLQTSREKHVADLEIKKRLTRILPDYQQLRSIIEHKRRGEFEERRRKATQQIELEKEKRRQHVREQRTRERHEAEHAERRRVQQQQDARVRAQHEERMAEQRRVEEAQRAELEAKKRAEIEERMAKLQATAERQRQREEEAEANLRARAADGAAAPAAGGAATWRRTGVSAAAAPAAAAAAAAAGQTTESQRPPVFGAARAGGGGGWREREAAKKAAGGDAAAAAAPTPTPTPAAAAAAAAAAAPAPATGAYRPGMLRGASGAAGGGWPPFHMSRITDASVARSAITALQPEPAARDADTISIRSRHTLHTFGGVDDDDEEDPWSAIPRNASSHAVPASEYPALSSAQRNQLLLRALLQLVALFVVCLIGVGGTLYVALPVISAADTPNLKVPRSFDDLKNLNSILQHYKTQHFASVLLCWVVVFMFLQAFSIPGSMYMSILCGALFGVPIALPLVCTSVATGASICYLISKNLGVILIALPSWQMRIDEWKHKLDQHRHNMLSYLVILRMMPLPPHNIVNILSPHLGISLGLFWISTFGGIFAVSVIHTTIGEKLDQMTSAHDFHLFSFRNMVLLGAVGFAVLIPVFVKRLATVENDDLDQGSSAHGQIFLDDDEDEQDELPRRILDTNNLGVDLDESFPNWHNNPNHEHDDADDDADADETDDEARLGYGRGGVFPDRSTTTRIGL